MGEKTEGFKKFASDIASKVGTEASKVGDAAVKKAGEVIGETGTETIKNIGNSISETGNKAVDKLTETFADSEFVKKTEKFATNAVETVREQTSLHVDRKTADSQASQTKKEKQVKEKAKFEKSKQEKKISKSKIKEDQSKKDSKKPVKIAAGIAVALVVIGISAGIFSEKDQISVGCSSSQLTGMNVDSAKEVFSKAGFSDIDVIADPDLVIGLLAQEGDVESVSVDGKESFEAGSKFDPNAKVTIIYHTFPEKEDSKTKEDNIPTNEAPMVSTETIETESFMKTEVTTEETETDPIEEKVEPEKTEKQTEKETAAETIKETEFVQETKIEETKDSETQPTEVAIEEPPVESIVPQNTVDLVANVPETEAAPIEQPVPTEQTSSWDKYRGNATFNGHYYGTPSGQKYHYTNECAGKNSQEISEAEAMSRGPCGTCVLK